MVVRGFEPVIMMNINIHVCVSTSIHIISQAQKIVLEIGWGLTHPNNLDDKKNEKKLQIMKFGGWGWDGGGCLFSCNFNFTVNFLIFPLMWGWGPPRLFIFFLC